MAEAIHRAHPRTFSIPRRVVRDSLRPGDYVKLSFRVDQRSGDVGAERMWVEVADFDGSHYSGRLANVPTELADLEPGASSHSARST